MTASDISVVSIEYLLSLRTTLVTLLDDYNAEQAEVLKDHVSLLKSVLDEHKPSDASRKQIESGKCKIADQDCELNKEFIDKCLDLAKEFEIDALYAAEFLQDGARLSIKYDRPAFACAIFLYHTKRHILLDSLRYIFEAAADANIDDQVQQFCISCIQGIKTDSLSALVDACVTQLARWKRQHQRLREESDVLRILRVAESGQDAQDFQAIILDQYECLTLMLSSLCSIFPAEHSLIEPQIDALAQASIWTDFISFDLILVARCIQNISASETNMVTRSTLTPASLAAFFRKLLPKVSSSSIWKCPPVRSILQAIIAAELNGLCRDFEDDFAGFDYDKDISSVFESALQDNVFQHMLTSFQFASCDTSSANPFAVFLDAKAYSFYGAAANHTVHALLVGAMTTCYRLFEQNFITNMPDQLKAIKLRAEDEDAAEDETQMRIDTGTRHLELFFGLIYTLAVDSPMHNRNFWDEPDGDMYGFLIWASYCDVPSMIFAYCTMLGALVSDSFGASSALAFLSVIQSPLDAGRLLPSSTISWPFLFESFRYYIRQLNGKSTAMYRQDVPEVDAQNVLILKSYLLLVRQLAVHIPEAQAVVDMESKFDCLATLFQLLSCPLPGVLCADILTAISAVSSRQFNLQIKSWKLLEVWIGSGLPSVQQEIVIQPRNKDQQKLQGLEALAHFTKSSPEVTKAVVDFLRSQNDCIATLAFRQLSMNGSANQGLQYGMAHYVALVFDILQHVSHQSKALSALSRIELTHVCLSYLVRALEAIQQPLLLLSQGRAVADGLGLSAGAQTQYLTLHPGFWVLHNLETGQASHLLLNLLQTHNVQDTVLQAKLEPCLAQGLELVHRVLLATPRLAALQHKPTEPNEITAGLFHQLLIEPHLAIHLCSLCIDAPLSIIIPSIAILRELLALTSHEQYSRILTTLVSVDHLKPILHGFLQLVESETAETIAQGCLALLSLLLADLRGHTESATVAHFLLGFEITSGHVTGRGQESGQIGSESSLLHAIMQVALQPDSQQGAPLAMQILAHLAERLSTSSIVLDEMHSLDFLNLALIVSSADAQLISVQAASDTSTSLTSLLTALDRRAAFLRISTRALLHFKEIESDEDRRYLVSRLVDPATSEGSSHVEAALCSYMDVFDIRLPNVSAPSTKVLDMHQYSELLEHENDANEAFTVAVDCRLEQLQANPNKDLYTAAISEAQELRACAANFVASMNLRAKLSSARQAWTCLAVPILDSCSELSRNRSAFLSVELLQHLLPALPRSVAEEEIDIEPLIDAVSLTIGKSYLQAIDLEQQQHFIGILLDAAQHHTTTADQKEKLFVALATLLNYQLTSAKSEQLKAIFVTLRSRAAKLVSSFSQCLLQYEGVLRLSSCILLDSLVSLFERFQPDLLPQLFISSNLLTQLVNHFAQSLPRPTEDVDVTDRQFGLLLRLCMNKEIAAEIAQWSTVFDALLEGGRCLSDGNGPLAIDDVLTGDLFDLRNASVAKQTMQLIATCCISLKRTQAKQLLEKYVRVLRDSAVRYKQAMQQNGHADWTEMTALCSLLDEMGESMQ